MVTYRKAEIEERQAIEDFVKANVRKFGKRFYINPVFEEKAIAEYIVKDILERMRNGIAFWACSESAKKGLLVATKSDWDSEVLRKNIGKLGLYASMSPTEIGEFLKKAYSPLQETEMDVLFGRVQIVSTKVALRAILADNVVLGDILVTLARNIHKGKSFAEADLAGRSDLVFEKGKETDEEQLKKITFSAYKHSHYFNDPKIPLEKAEAVYQKWISNSLHGFVDSVIVARSNGKTVGYITLRIEKLGQRSFGIIDLIAVQESHRGQGIGKMLVAEGIRQLLDRVETLYVSTQVSNMPALRLYKELGFRPILREATFHVWLRTQEERFEIPLSSRPAPTQSPSKARVVPTSMGMRTVVISQPTYLPWLGYFRIMKEADLYVFLDSVQFERRSWQTRNRIKTPTKWTWLTVPTLHESTKTLCLIKDVKIDNSKNWQRVHWNAIQTSYGKAPYFKEYSPFFKSTYEKKWDTLASLDIHIIKYLASKLGISPLFFRSSEMHVEGKRTQLLLNICRTLDSNRYVSSIGAKEYMENDGARELFKENGISVDFVTFNEPRYPQLFGKFIPQLSAIDCFFNLGPDDSRILLEKSFVTFHPL